MTEIELNGILQFDKEIDKDKLLDSFLNWCSENGCIYGGSFEVKEDKGKKYAAMLDELESVFRGTRFFVKDAMGRDGGLTLFFNKKVLYDTDGAIDEIQEICKKHLTKEEMELLYVMYDWCNEIPEDENCVCRIIK